MAVSDDDVRHVASLARIGLDPARVPLLVRELNGILAHMDVLAAVDTSSLGEAPDETLPAPRLRADEPRSPPPSPPRERSSPATRDGFYLVPRLSTHEDTA